MSLSKKERAAMPAGLAESIHDMLLEKFGYLGLYNLVHPDGDKEKTDAMRQFADCQTNLIAQKDLYEAFQNRFGKDEADKKRVLGLLAEFNRDHANEDQNLNSLRILEDVTGGTEWDKDLVRFCKELEKIYPEAYRINQLAFTLNTDVTIFRDALGAIANWTVVYNHPVYPDDDQGKTKDQVNLTFRRPLLKKEASQLARTYTRNRLLDCTSEKYRNTPEDARLQQWPNVAEQVHSLLPRIVSTVSQKNGPPVEVGSLFLEVAAWFIVNLAANHSLVFNVRRREMKPAVKAPENAEEGSEADEEPQIDKIYRASSVLTFLAVPNEAGTDYVFREDCPEEYGDVANGFAECISYYDADQKGSDLDSVNDEEFRKTILKMSPLLVMLPMLTAHKPHPGLAESNSPKYNLYETVSPPHQPLKVTPTTFQGLTLGTNDRNLKQASINDWRIYGGMQALERGHFDTMEYSFSVDRQCMALRKQPIDLAPRHMHMSSFNEARRKGKIIMDLQKQADKTGAIFGGYACRNKNMVLNVLTKGVGDRISGISQSNARLAEYKKEMPQNKVFYDLTN